LTDRWWLSDDRAVQSLSLRTIGGACGVLTFVSFLVGIPLMAASGVQVLIPETGQNGLDWLRDVNDAGGAFFAGAWLVILGGLFGLVALVAFYDVLKDAGPVMILAPILGAVGLTLVTISHLLPIAMAYELAPGYESAGSATQDSLAVTTNTLAVLSLVLNYVGDFLGWGVVVPLYAWAILKTSALPRWLGWLGLVVAVFAGWLGLLSPASGVVDGLTTIGFFAFFVFMLGIGVALLRRPRPAPPAPAVSS
jgi:hypothetical protein